MPVAKNLTQKELDFCDKHNVDPLQVFDAEGIKTQRYKEIMSDESWLLAANVTPCKKCHQSLRLSSGHCAFCDPKKLQFRKRYKENGFIYLAITKSDKNIIKIGATSKVSTRQASLNSGSYAGFKNWEIIFFEFVTNMGRVEEKVQKELHEYRCPRVYLKQGKEQKASELFKCSSQEGMAAINFVLQSAGSASIEAATLPKNHLLNSLDNKIKTNTQKPKKQKSPLTEFKPTSSNSQLPEYKLGVLTTTSIKPQVPKDIPVQLSAASTTPQIPKHKIQSEKPLKLVFEEITTTETKTIISEISKFILKVLGYFLLFNAILALFRFLPMILNRL